VRPPGDSAETLPAACFPQEENRFLRFAPPTPGDRAERFHGDRSQPAAGRA